MASRLVRAAGSSKPCATNPLISRSLYLERHNPRAFASTLTRETHALSGGPLSIRLGIWHGIHPPTCQPNGWPHETCNGASSNEGSLKRRC